MLIKRARDHCGQGGIGSVMKTIRLVIPVGCLLLAAMCVGWFGWLRASAHAAAPADPAAVPITAAPAKAEDVPVYLSGMGTVQAFSTVEIKAQVSGTLVAVPVKEGQEVQKGDIVAEIDPRPFKAALDQAMAQRAGDAAQLQSAILDLRRYQALAQHHYAPQQQVDDQQATVNKLMAAVQADSAAIETAQINLGFCTIRAPISGRVSLYQTDAGNLIEVSSQTGIVSITQDKPISVVFTLPESELPRVQDAMTKRQPPVLVYTGDRKTKLAQGSLLTPNNTIDTATGTIQLKAVFQNDDDRLWPGEFVDAQVLVDTLHGAVTVPLAAVQHGPDGLFVYTVDANNTVHEQKVEISYQNTGTAVVAKGLQPGQNVVVAGQSRLAPGMRVVMNNTAPASQKDTGRS